MAVNVVQTALSSRRFNRWLFVLGTIVLVAGIIAIVVTKVGGSSSPAEKANPNPTGPPISEIEKAPPNIRFPKAAWKVVQKFVYGAVARKDLAGSYAVTDANMRGGFTLGQWKTGNIPVTNFPAAKIIRYNWKNTNFTHPREAALNLILVPPAHTAQRPQTFLIFVKKFGRGAKAHWMVDYFNIVASPPVPTPK
jgi:hypothetical protein